MIFKILDDFKKSIFLDNNEKYFVKNIRKNIKKNTFSNNIIFINIAMDYFHLVQVNFLLQNKKYEKYKIVGIWNYNITPNWKNKSYILEKLINLKNNFKFFFLKKKWSKIYTAIGVNEIIDTNNSNHLSDDEYEKRSNDILKNIKNLGKNKFIKLKINNILVGDLIIDTYIRFRNIQTVKFDDYFLKEIIKKFVISQLIIQKSIRKFKPNTLIMNFSNYSNGVLARTAIENKLKVFCTGDTMSYIKKLSKNDSGTHTSYKNFKKLFQNLKSKNQKLKIAKYELNKRFTGVKDQAYFYMKKSPYRKNKKKLKFKIDGVLFLHDFFDTPHHFKSMFFFDFYDWATFTLNIIRKYKLNIAVKPHPNSIYQNKVVVDNLKKKYPDIKWISPDLTNTQIFKSGIKFGISIYGSVLYELAYHNLVPIASTPYHPTFNYDVVYTPKNKYEYSKLLINSKKLKLKKNLKKKIQEFYYMWTFYNHDAMNITGRKLKLKNIDFSKSKSLKIYHQRLLNFQSQKEEII